MRRVLGVGLEFRVKDRTRFGPTVSWIRSEFTNLLAIGGRIRGNWLF